MTMLNPFSKVQSALQNTIELANQLVQRGVSGTRERFTRKSFIKVEYIPLKKLKVDSKYQRLINTNFVKKAKKFKPKLVKPLSVFLRPDGDYVVVMVNILVCLQQLMLKIHLILKCNVKFKYIQDILQLSNA